MRDELEALLGAPALASDEVARWRLEVSFPGLSITVALRADGVDVELEGWRWRGPLSEALEDRADDEAIALDLIAAALYGDVRLRVELAGGRVHRRTLEVRRVVGRRGGDGALETEWSVVGSQGRPALNPFARRETQLLANARSRPAVRVYAPLDPPLPWAPWAGAASYCRPDDVEGPGDATELLVDGELDLHNFHPREVKPLVLEYIEVCKARQIFDLRIVHGKGKGVLRRTVHAILDGHPDVVRFELGGHDGGSWGATRVWLRHDGPVDAG